MQSACLKGANSRTFWEPQSSPPDGTPIGSWRHLPPTEPRDRSVTLTCFGRSEAADTGSVFSLQALANLRHCAFLMLFLRRVRSRII